MEKAGAGATVRHASPDGFRLDINALRALSGLSASTSSLSSPAI
jgi:hypothetical protein